MVVLDKLSLRVHVLTRVSRVDTTLVLVLVLVLALALVLALVLVLVLLSLCVAAAVASSVDATAAICLLSTAWWRRGWQRRGGRS